MFLLPDGADGKENRHGIFGEALDINRKSASKSYSDCWYHQGSDIFIAWKRVSHACRWCLGKTRLLLSPVFAFLFLFTGERTDGMVDTRLYVLLLATQSGIRGDIMMK